MKQRQRRTGSTLAAGLCALLGAHAHADPAPSCSNRTAAGHWIYTCEGTLPTPAQTNTRSLGSCSGTRTGYFTCSGYANVGGQVIPQALQGQAQTQANCTGTISYAQTLGGQPAGQIDIYFAIDERGRRINGLPTNTGGVLACSLRRID